MSQAGIVDIEGTHPQIPTSFVTNMGTAIPIGNVLEILGTIVSAHGIPLETTGSGNTVTIVTQYASAAASSIGTNAGLASFNSTDFTVDANGFVTLSTTSAEAFTVDASTPPGTNPVTPNGSGIVTVTGGQVAAGTTTNVIRTDSLAANTYTIQIQRSQAVAASTIGDNGVSHFNSTYFTVDANGFVSIVPSAVGSSFTVDANTAPGTNPVLPNGSGNITVTGGQVAAGTTANVIRTDSLAANTYTIQIQRSQAVGSSTVGDNGVSHFNSTYFTVDANGFVSLNGAAVGETITGNSGGALSPTAGNWNILGASVAAGTTPVKTVGSGSTLTVDVQISQAIASTNATNVGLAAFNSAQFTVDSNGFVSLVGGGASVEKFALQTGTTPIAPSSGIVTFNGATVAAGTNPVQTNGTGASTMQLQVQLSQAIASTNATNVGLAAFNSTYFTVDSNGFVSLNGSGVGETITGNSGGALSPTGGNWNILGSSVAAGTTPVTTIGSGSTLTVDVQRAQAIASTNATNVGLAAFNSAQFTVDSNGFVSITNFSPFAYTQINHASSPYTVLSTDNYISADPTAGTISILLPNAPTTYRKFIIKDRTGQASTNNISVTTVGGSVTIDGQTTYTMASNFSAIELLFNGTNYEVY